MKPICEYPIRILQGIVALFLAGLASFVVGQTPSASQTLSLNHPVERTIRGGGAQSFQFPVDAGQYARVEVEQKNIDVIVSLFAPDGRPVVDMDGKDFVNLWREVVSCMAETDGLYRFEVRAYGTAEASGNYTVKLIEIRPSEPNDHKWIEAEQHFSRARRLNLEHRSSDAVKEYQVAAGIWHELCDYEWEAIALVRLGWTYDWLSKNDEELSSFNEAVRLFRTTKIDLAKAKAFTAWDMST